MLGASSNVTIGPIAQRIDKKKFARVRPLEDGAA